MINYAQLRIFVTVVEEGSLAKAALKLNLTPSAISHALKQLENRFGVVLLTRSKGGIRISKAGEQLFPILAKSFAKIDVACNDLLVEPSQFTFASTHTFLEFFFLPLVPRIHKILPKIKMESMSMRSTVESVRNGKVSLGCVLQTHDNLCEQDLESYLLCSIQDVLVARRDVFYSEKPILLSDLNKIPLIGIQKHSLLHDMYERHFLAHGEKIHIQIELLQMNLMALLAVNGEGVSLLHDFVANKVCEANPQLHILPLVNPLPRKDLILIKRKDYKNPLIHRVIKTILEYFSTIKK